MYVMLWACMKALKIVGLRFPLLELPVMAHFARFRSMCAHTIGEDG